MVVVVVVEVVVVERSSSSSEEKVFVIVKKVLLFTELNGRAASGAGRTRRSVRHFATIRPERAGLPGRHRREVLSFISFWFFICASVCVVRPCLVK